MDLSMNKGLNFSNRLKLIQDKAALIVFVIKTDFFIQVINFNLLNNNNYILN